VWKRCLLGTGGGGDGGPALLEQRVVQEIGCGFAGWLLLAWQARQQPLLYKGCVVSSLPGAQVGTGRMTVVCVWLYALSRRAEEVGPLRLHGVN
jgi:hypothetical protein